MPRCSNPLCGSYIPRRKSQCPVCLAFTFTDGAGKKGTGLVPLADAQPNEERPRIQTGVCDAVWGGPKRPGVKDTAVYLLSGGPGAGKTTLLFQVLRGLAREREIGPIPYLGNEQEKEDLYEYARRTGWTDAELARLMVPEERGEVTYPISEDILSLRPSALVQDSLPGVEGSDLADSLAILTGFRDVCKRKIPIFVVNHVNADYDMAGLTSFQHAVEWTGMLRPVGVERRKLVTRRGSKTRLLEAWKNRTGPEASAILDMTDGGLVPHAKECACEFCKAKP
jgi:DNA repair protein RadA/Sms